MADEKKRFDDDSKWDTLFYLRLTKKRLLCRVGEKLDEKYYFKHYPFSSQLSLNVGIKIGNKLDISSYTPSKSRHISKPQPISFYLTSFKRDISNDGAIDFAGGRSQITVIYKQQS